MTFHLQLGFFEGKKKTTQSCLDSKETDPNPPQWFGGKSLIRWGSENESWHQLSQILPLGLQK